MPSSSGEAIGHYKLIERIGSGGLGEIYRARDRRLGRTVAIKILPADLVADAARFERFLKAARAVAGLSHHGIATLFDIGQDGSRWFLVYEFVPGETLRAVINGRPLNPRRAVDFGVQLADALADVHASELLHGDIRPDTIIVNTKEHVKLTDCGLAEFTRGGSARLSAAAQVGAGAQPSPAVAPYLAPEQVIGARTAAPSDLFSLGVVLFEMLTGRTPFQGATPAETALKIVQSRAPAPSSVNRTVPQELDAILEKILVKSVDARSITAATLAAELRAVGAILDVRTEASEAEPPPRPAARGRMGRVAVALAALAVVAGGAWAFRERAADAWRHWFGPPPAPLIAITPIRAGDGLPPESRYYTNGVTADLVARLGATPGIRVLGRSRVSLAVPPEPREAARETGAAAALSGSVALHGDEVTVELELTDAATGARAWTQTFSRPRSRIFAVYNDAAEALARYLRVAPAGHAAGERAASRVVDPAAYDAYLRGRTAEAEGNLPDALALYSKATDIDSGLSEAQAAAALLGYRQAIAAARLEDGEAWVRLRRAAESAVNANPDLPAAQIAAGLAAPTLTEALRSLRRAAELDPSSGESYRYIASLIAGIDPGRALSFYRRSLELDRGGAERYVETAGGYVLLGNPAEAERELARGRPANADAPIWPAALATIRMAEGRADAAAALLAPVVSRGASPMARLVYLRALAGSAGTRTALAEAERDPDRYTGSCAGRAVVAALRYSEGRRDAAREVATRMASEAGAPGAPAGLARCAALAAAGVQDASAAADWLRQIAAREEALRLWLLPIEGETGQSAATLGWFPWKAAIGGPAVRAALDAIDEARAGLRAQAAGELAGMIPEAAGP
jgi:TolB-like protein